MRPCYAAANGCAARSAGQLVAAHRAGDDLINTFRRLVLAVDFLILVVGELTRHEAAMPGDRREKNQLLVPRWPVPCCRQ